MSSRSSLPRTDLSAGSRPRLSQAFCVATPVGQRSVWHFCAWMHPSASIASRPTLTVSTPRAKAIAAVVGQPELAGAGEHDPLVEAALGEDGVTAREAEAEGHGDGIREDERCRTGATLTTVDGDEVDTAVSTAIRSPSCSQNAMSPTADLTPTGSPVSAASSSTQSSRLSTSENSAWRDGLMQSLPIGMPRVAEISGDTFGRWEQATEPWLGALGELHLERLHRRRHDEVFQPRQVEASLVVTAAEVGGTDLEHELAAVTVVRRQPTLAGVLRAPDERRAPVERLDGAARTANRSSSPRS